MWLHVLAQIKKKQGTDLIFVEYIVLSTWMVKIYVVASYLYLQHGITSVLLFMLLAVNTSPHLGSDNGLALTRRRAIIWTIAG